MSMSLTLLAQQSQYATAYALIFAVVLLGVLVIAIPRPRKKAFGSNEEERRAMKDIEKEKVRSRNSKNRKKREKKRRKASKKKLKN